MWQKIGGRLAFVFKDLCQTFGQNEPTNEKSIWNKSRGVVGITVLGESFTGESWGTITTKPHVQKIDPNVAQS